MTDQAENQEQVNEPEQQAGAQSPMEELEQSLSAAQQEAADTLDKYRRTAAEFSNYRKRQERDRDQQRVLMQIDLFRRLLPTIDDWDRAMAHVPEEMAGSQWIQGMRLIHQKFQALLADSQVQAIETVGQPFDPKYHEALMQQPSDEYEAGLVSMEVVKGYRLGDYVLRPAQVAVSTGPIESN